MVLVGIGVLGTNTALRQTTRKNYRTTLILFFVKKAEDILVVRGAFPFVAVSLKEMLKKQAPFLNSWGGGAFIIFL